MLSLPADTHLAYVVSHEAWYAATPGIVRKPEIQVRASAKGSGGGVAWEFAVTEHDLSGDPCIKAGVFDDAFAAFGQIPEFFAALAAEGAGSLDDVRRILDGLGAVDETDRRDVLEGTPRERTRRRIARAIRVAGTEFDGDAVEVFPDVAAARVMEALSTEGDADG